MYFVYVLRSLKDKRRYVGQTADIAKRIRQHNADSTESTRRRRPFELLYEESYDTRADAKAREKHLKSGKGREELNEILKGRGLG